MEAIDFVNSVTEDDASKDFSEKEIRISENICKETVEEISLERCRIPFKNQPENVVVVKSEKRPSRFVKNKIKIIEAKFRDAIKRGKSKLCKQLSFHQIQLCLPILTCHKRENPSVCDLLDENNGLYVHSLQEFMSRDNDRKSFISVSVKLFTTKIGQWLPSRIECNNQYKDLEIFTRPSISFKIPLEGLGTVRIEDNRRILWIKGDGGLSSDVVGFLFDKCSTLERFMLLLDYAIRCRSHPSQHPFLNGRLKLSLVEKPNLFSCAVTWLPYHRMNMQFLGYFSYHLKTSSKEIKSIEPAQFFTK